MGNCSGSSGRGGGSGGGTAKQTNAVLNPSSKDDYINQLNVIAEDARNGFDGEINVSVRDWANYGKDRTYFKIYQYRKDGKLKGEYDFGFFDNVSGTYNEGKKKLRTGEDKISTLSGSTLTANEITNILKRMKK